jgi:hypothetical protein
MQRRHELVLGLERNRVDPRPGGDLGRAVHAELGREGVQRPSVGSPSTFQTPSCCNSTASLQSIETRPISSSTGSLGAGSPSRVTLPSGA